MRRFILRKLADEAGRISDPIKVYLETLVRHENLGLGGAHYVAVAYVSALNHVSPLLERAVGNLDDDGALSLQMGGSLFRFEAEAVTVTPLPEPEPEPEEGGDDWLD
jgi:hypothetical protein